MEKDFEIAALLDYYVCFLTDKQALCVDYYYNEDFSLSEIGECLNITRQGVYDNLKRAESILLDSERKLQLYKKSKMFYQQKQDITKEINTILSKRNIISQPIVDRLLVIQKLVSELSEFY